jgi:hypothetical protein
LCYLFCSVANYRSKSLKEVFIACGGLKLKYLKSWKYFGPVFDNRLWLQANIPPFRSSVFSNLFNLVIWVNDTWYAYYLPSGLELDNLIVYNWMSLTLLLHISLGFEIFLNDFLCKNANLTSLGLSFYWPSLMLVYILFMTWPHSVPSDSPAYFLFSISLQNKLIAV